MLIQAEIIADGIGQDGSGLRTVEMKYLPAQAEGHKILLRIIVYHPDQVSRKTPRIKELLNQVSVRQVHDIAKLPTEQVR